MAALESLQAVLLITKHLDTLLPFLLAVRRIPAELPQRIGLLQSIAVEIASDGSFASDWYTALELLTGEDLSNRSVGDLLMLSVEQLSNGRIGDIWSAAFSLGLLDEESLGHWMLFGGLTDGDTSATD